ncbi:hypothetical protein [Calidithermus timidus]|jgi:hypothetical protein|uniref:hypothetical protein n=1 Tax=Calidithermus timidus TaxID=307124 RepID=UPI0003806AEC|nr:hypothetical protein [Calidithermus timidus]
MKRYLLLAPLLLILVACPGTGGSGGGNRAACVKYPSADFPQDSFGDSRPVAGVAGTTSPEGTRRLVTDLEQEGPTAGRMSIDNCSLRMPPLFEPSFGRMGVAYPSVPRQNGKVIHFRLTAGDVQEENSLVFGGFDSPNPTTPMVGSNAILLRNFGQQGGTFDFGSKTGAMESGLPQFQTQLDGYVILRERGAVYVVDGLAGGYYGVPPKASVIGLDQSLTSPELYPGVHSANQVYAHRIHHFQVRDVAAWQNWYATAHAADRLTNGPPGTAEKGGTWTTTGNFGSSANGVTADAGGAMAMLDPGAPSQVLGLTVTTGNDPQGVGIIFRANKNGGVYTDYYELFISSTKAELVRVSGGIPTEITATTEPERLLPKNATVYLQLIDSGPKDTRFSAGGRIRVLMNEKEVLSAEAPIAHFTNADNNNSANFTGVGFRIAPGSAGGTAVSYFEAHPRTITLPSELLLPEQEAPLEDTGSVVVASDDFSGGYANLAGRKTPVGGLTWEKKASRNENEYLVVDGAGHVTVFPRAQDSSRSSLLLYGLPWPSQYRNFASLEATIIPAGEGVLREEGATLGVGQRVCSGFDETSPSKNNRLRAGLFLWQDRENYILLRGFMDNSQSDASEVEWQVPERPDYAPVVRRTNLGVRWCHGLPTTLRLSFDGERITLWVKGAVGKGDPDTQFEPVQTLRWSDLFPDRPTFAINMVGIYYSEDDTGARIDNFKALGR